MKIGIITYAFHTSTMPLAKYLTVLGHKVDLYCLVSSSSPDQFTINLTKFKLKNGFVPQKIMNNIIDENILTYLNTLNSLNIYLYSKRRKFLYVDYFYSILVLGFKINKGKYDCLHFIGQNEAYIHLSKILLPPKVFTFHEINEFSRDNKIIKAKLVNYISKKNNNVIFHSLNMKAKYIQDFNPKNRNISVIKFGLFETYKLIVDDSPEESDTILYYGIIQKYKGLEYLLDAFKLVKKEIKNIKLLVAGRGEIYFDRNKIEDTRIEFINRPISEEELVRLNRRATIVVCPYISASQSGIPVTSFIFNKPIIASDVEGLSEYIIDGYNGLLVPPKDSISLAQKITDLLRDTGLRLKIKDNIIKMNNNNNQTWLSIAEQTVKLYKDEIDNLKK
jgi:glycosyltransferase involved in cell wall biosynthesis